MLKILLLSSLTSLYLSADTLTLKNVVSHTLDTNPQMQQSLSDYRAIKHDLDIAYSGYKPTLDFNAGIGYEKVDRSSVNSNSDSKDGLVRREVGVRASENLFEGLATKYDIKQQDARINSARHKVLQDANILALKVVETYLNVLREKAILILQKENIQTHERIYKMIREKTTQGVGRLSDLEQTEARLALAYSSYITQMNNYQDTVINLERLYGSKLSASMLAMPNIPNLPSDTIERLNTISLKYNPTLLTEKANIQTQQNKMQKDKAGFYPRVDLDLSANMNENINGIKGVDNSYKGMLNLTYNLYRGSIDESTRLQNIQYITSQKESLNEQQRAVLEKLQLSWMSKQILERKIKCLNVHTFLSKKAADSYSKEYQLGRRSLLDLLNIELEYIESKKAIVRAENEITYSHFRILEATGLLNHLLETTIDEQLGLISPDDVNFTQVDSTTIYLAGTKDDFIDIDSICEKTAQTVLQNSTDTDSINYDSNNFDNLVK